MGKDKITWDVVDNEKMEYVAKRNITKEMSAAEKKGAELWNQMVDIVRSTGRMEDKK